MAAGCEEEERTWTVTYRVDPRATGSGEFRVRYRTQNQSTVEAGPFDAYWESAPLINFKDGELVSLEVVRISGSSRYNYAILRNGAVHEEGEMAANESSKTIDDRL